MAGELGLPSVAPAQVDLPAVGRYNVFLNSADSDYAYKKDSAGVVTSLTLGLVNPMSTLGAIIYGGIAGIPTSLVVGTPGQVLTVSGGNIPSWATPTTGTVTSVAISGGTTGVGVSGSPITGSGTITLTVPVATSSASTIVARDASQNAFANNFVSKATNVVSAGATTVLTAASTRVQTLTGTLAQTFQLPDATTLSIGSIFEFDNNSTQTLTVVNAGSGAITTVVSGGYARVKATAVSTANGAWNTHFLIPENSSWGTAGMIVAGTMAGSSSLTLGTASTTAGTAVFQNATNAFTQTLRGTNPVASIIYDLPTTAPTAGQVLQSTAPSAGVATLSWATAGGVAGSTTQVQYNDVGAMAGDADFTWDKTNNILNIGTSAGSATTNGINLGGSKFLRTNNNFITIGNATAGSWAVAIGNTTNTSAGVRSVAIGGTSTAIATTSGDYSASVGGEVRGTGTAAYLYGYGIDGAAYNGIIGIGANFSFTANNQGILGANDGVYYVSNWYYNGVTSTSPQSVILNAVGGSGSNVASASMSFATQATGNAASGNFKTRTSVKAASSSTLQSLTDRHVVSGKYVDITGGAATTFGTLALTTSGTIAGGFIVYTVEANDGTDYQSLSGCAPYSVVNKAGALTVALGTDSQSSACSSGTLTGTLSVTSSGTSLQWQMNAVSSLTETVLRIKFQVFNQFGVATILPA